MTKKQLKIQEAYGPMWEGMAGSDRECALKYDGWINKFEYNVKGETSRLASEFKKHNIPFYEWGGALRPVALKGVEDNNGWTVIEDVSLLPNEPKQSYEVGCFDADGDFVVNSTRVGSARLFDLYTKGGITHYREVVPFKQPVY